ncbi:MAG: cytochrome c3 family protein [Nitrospirae bacterium]|nr:cytochrome c3 family protein [Nitrospirota bacterium]
MSYKKLLTLVAPLLVLTFFAPGTGSAQESANCLACHTSMKGRLKTAGGTIIELNIDSEKFQASVHGSLSCTDCHMRFTDNPHATPGAAVPAEILATSSKISAKHTIDPVAAAACSKCHKETYEKVLNSIHGKNIAEKHQTDGAFCLDCHGSPHYIVPVKNPDSKMSRKNQIETCGRCHEDKKILEKYNLQENVIPSFIESFHGRKLHLGHTKVPVCTSCHNYHDIKAKDDPSSPVFGNNRIETCGKCHKGANEKFIPAITHRPPGPIPHYTEKGLIVLLLSTFAFIIVHVLLEAFSDIRDSVFRKGRKE